MNFFEKPALDQEINDLIAQFVTDDGVSGCLETSLEERRALEDVEAG